MYEMEGPRLVIAALACRLPGHRAPRDCHWPRVSASGTGGPGLAASWSFLQAEHVFSGESSSTAKSARHTRPLPRRLQDSLAVHRTSTVYPLCAPAFHRHIHTTVHRMAAGRRRREHGAQSSPAGGPEESQKRTGHAQLQRLIRSAPRGDDPVGTERTPVRAAVKARDRGQGRLRAVTVAIGAASVLAGGGIAAALPSAVATQSPASSSSSSSHSQQSTSASSGSGSGSSSGTSSSGTSSPGALKSSSAPSSSSGSGQVTSGGS
jgi:hypothetical protein